ncbi:MAG: transposon-encoded TnpW family protein [Oscillospiraceae bacterium]|nr:transposon-encoded TnpW family protein [Lachnospiraceae bacterium]MBQ5318860.1 transposon-encoded TnpW family protein [Oscillospiraceae bacterium]
MKKTDTTKRVQEKRKGFTKKIGNTTYDVSFHYSRQSRESMNDKIIRLIENDMQGMKKN